MHGIVGQASIIIIACKASCNYYVVTLDNNLKNLDTSMHVDVCCAHTNQAVSR